MGVYPRIPEARMFLDYRNGEARWYAVEVTNLVQKTSVRSESQMLITSRTAITYRPPSADCRTSLANSQESTSLCALKCSGPVSPPPANSLLIRSVPPAGEGEVYTRLTCELKTCSWPRMGCASNTLTAALPTNQSPPRTSRGDPASEYGWEVAPIIGKREKKARPAPRAPLESSV